MTMRLDVTEVLFDPEFMDTIDVVRNTESVDEHGLTILTPQTIRRVKAVITQHNGDILRREMAGQHVEGSISVYTTFELTDGRDIGHKELGADLVVYPSGTGDRYTVTKINNYMRYGRGFVSATCELLPLEPAS